MEASSGGGSAKVRVIAADDDPVALSVVEAVLANEEALELVGTAPDAESAIGLARDQKPDVAVLDWVMPGGGGPHAAQHILEVSPATNIVALTAHDTEQAAFDMLRSGAKSYLFKGAPPEELVDTILNVARL